MRKAASLLNKAILPTRISAIEKIKDAVDVLRKAGFNKENITVLHCNTESPTIMLPGIKNTADLGT